MQIRVRLLGRTYLPERSYAFVRTSGVTLKFKLLC